MSALAEKIAQIEKEIRETPYHKGTEHHIGLLKAKLAKLRSQLAEIGAKKGGGVGFAIPKEGDATCVLVGLPSVGKSTILAKLTAAKPKIASYPFTTLSVIPGVLNYKGAVIQILDVPGLVGRASPKTLTAARGAAKGVGKGREVLSLARIADLLIIVAVAENFSEQKTQVLLELEENRVRVNQKKPEVSVKKIGSGGLKIVTVANCGLDRSQIEGICQELGLVNGQIQVKDKISQEDLIDVILGNRVYLPAIFVASKGDLANIQFQNNDVIQTSALKNLGFDRLKEKIWQKLGLIRVYLKKPADKEPDFEKPLILKYRSTILEGAEKISTELAGNFKSAKLIRNNFKTQVSRNFQLQEGDIITFLT